MAGDIHVTGAITSTSDIRLKEHVRPLYQSLAKLSALDGISYRMKGAADTRIEYGFSAQQAIASFPHLVHASNDDMGTMSINYIGLIAPIVEAIKELKAENDRIRTENAKLQLRLDRLEDAHARNRR